MGNTKSIEMHHKGIYDLMDALRYAICPKCKGVVEWETETDSNALNCVGYHDTSCGLTFSLHTHLVKVDVYESDIE